MTSRHLKLIITSLVLSILLTASLMAIPPSPEAIEKWKAEGTLEQKLIKWRMVDKVEAYLEAQDVWDKEKFRTNTALGIMDTLYVVVSLVDFEDMQHTENASEFDSLLFSVKGAGGYINPTGSWTDFYLENSYGKVFVKGIVSGWHRMNKPYSYYVGPSQDDTGVNSGELAREAALATDADVDYEALQPSGYFVGFVVVHAGAGAEAGAYGIWSHKGGFDKTVMIDSVILRGYTMNPEKYGSGISTMGVFAHEYGHALGLPDLYDTDYYPETSNGLGKWSMMAGGSWNGLNRGGDTPAHFDAWCKLELGYLEATILKWNTPEEISPPVSIIQAPIPQVESEPVVYMLINDGDDSWGEYWLVENRQQVGFDAALPGAGLCIYHIDIWQSHNSTPGLYKVALEQADGKDGLAFGGSSGDRGDPFPGSSNNREFGSYTSPNSMTHNDVISQIGVWNISDSDSLMFADLEAGYTRPFPELYSENGIQFSDVNGGDGDGVLEPGETIEFRCRISNNMAQSFDPWVKLSSDHPDLVFSPSWVSLGVSLNPIADYNTNDYPISFTIPEGIEPINVNFTLTLVSDHLCCGTSEQTYTSTWEFGQVLGQPKVMIIDNDGGLDYDQAYQTTISDLGYAWGKWDMSSKGSPTADDLKPYEIVLYMSGKTATDGTLSINDVNAYTGYLNSGGRLAFVSASAATQLNNLSPNFLANYMHLNYDGSGAFGYNIEGIDGSGMGDGLSFTYNGALAFPGSHDKILPVSPAESVFYISFGTPRGTCGVTYSGAVYKTIMLTTPLEFYDNSLSGYNTSTDMMQAIINFFDGIATDVIEDNNQLLPGGFFLSQNYPNPFNPTTSISYTVPRGESGKALPTSLQIFNVLGQNVKILVDKAQLPGEYTVDWDGRNEAGDKMASGIYLYRLVTGNEKAAKKMVLVK